MTGENPDRRAKLLLTRGIVAWPTRGQHRSGDVPDRLGFSPVQVGAIITGTLLGSAAVTLASGLLGYRLSRRRILLGSTALMVLT